MCFFTKFWSSVMYSLSLVSWWKDKKLSSCNATIRILRICREKERDKGDCIFTKEIFSLQRKQINEPWTMSHLPFSLLSNSDHVWFLTPNLSRFVDKCYYFTKGGQFRKQTSGFVEKKRRGGCCFFRPLLTVNKNDGLSCFQDVLVKSEVASS